LEDECWGPSVQTNTHDNKAGDLKGPVLHNDFIELLHVYPTMAEVLKIAAISRRNVIRQSSPAARNNFLRVKTRCQSRTVSLLSLPQNRGGNLASAGGKGDVLGLEIRVQRS
jgi:hypothetical protein